MCADLRILDSEIMESGTNIKNWKQSMNTTSKKYLRLIGLIIYFVSACSFISYGQTRTESREITDNFMPASVGLSSPSGDPQKGDFGTIGLFNGRLNYTIPLLNLGGRGTTDHTISLGINNIWTYQYETIYQLDFDGNDVGVLGTYANPSFESVNTLPRYVPGRLEEVIIPDPYPICSQDAQSESLVFEKLIFNSSSGGQINLLPKDYPWGVKVQCIYNDPMGGNYTPKTLGHIFLSVDGSGVKFISDEEAWVGVVLPKTGYLYFPNGLRYRIEDGFVMSIEDKNGNKTKFIYEIEPYSGRKTNLTHIIDSNGLVVSVAYNLHNIEFGYHDEITYSSYNGSSKKIRITFDQLEDVLRSDNELKTIAQLFPIGVSYCNPVIGTTCHPQNTFNPYVISSVIFADNRRFHYKYNSYGELSRVETPNGAAFEYDWGGSLDGGDVNGEIEYSGTLPDLFRQVLEKRVYVEGGSGSSFESKTQITKSEQYDQFNPPQQSTRTI